jgi:hypothetical protein
MKSWCLEMIKECLYISSMRLGVPFIPPRQLGVVGGNQGRQFLPSVGWRIGQSGAPPDRHCSMSGAYCLPKLAQPTVEYLDVGAPDTVRCTLDSLVPHLTVGSATRHARIARPTVGAVDRWLTGQSGAPPDSPVNYSRTPPSSPESGLFTETGPGAPDTFRCTTGQSGAPRLSSCWLYTANSFPKRFLLFPALRHNTLVFNTMY